MKAYTKTTYGGPEVLRLESVEKPKPKANELLVQVMANSANPADWHILRGKPRFARLTTGLFRPKQRILGADFAGVVVDTGEQIHRFKVGDRVFGETLEGGAFAAYTCVPESVCATMPPESGFAEMAGVPVAGLTALQAIVTHGKLQQGETVLINGSSGGVGHFAVQIAKACGGHVTAVCSSLNVDFVMALGANRVIAYDEGGLAGLDSTFDLVLDTHGNLTYADYKRWGKRGVMVGFTTVSNLFRLSLRKALGLFPLTQFTAEANTTDLATLASLIEAGKVRVHLERTYSYREIPEAIRYIEAMRTRGKVAMVWDE